MALTVKIKNKKKTLPVVLSVLLNVNLEGVPIAYATEQKVILYTHTI